MLHRAILGSLERWIGILIEQYSGRMPAWLSPVQLVVAAITDSAHDYAKQVHTAALVAGMRAELDTRNEKIGYKIKNIQQQRCPSFWLLVDGRQRQVQ